MILLIVGSMLKSAVVYDIRHAFGNVVSILYIYHNLTIIVLSK